MDKKCFVPTQFFVMTRKVTVPYFETRTF